jgi:hypothetical protein
MEDGVAEIFGGLLKTNQHESRARDPIWLPVGSEGRQVAPRQAADVPVGRQWELRPADAAGWAARTRCLTGEIGRARERVR